MNQRAASIDALRGYAIITMVLSATVVYGILPGWMYHAQVPPPSHEFNPALPGITWVDMVFPAFLFAMGAALPFSVGRKLRDGVNAWHLAALALWRGIKLAFFAITIQHFYPYMLSGESGIWRQLTALFCFVMLFAIYMRLPATLPRMVRISIRIVSVAIVSTVMLFQQYADGSAFSPAVSNIIILILANVVVFSTWLYIASTRVKSLTPCVLAILGVMFVAGDSDAASWQHSVLSYSPLQWLYNPHYLKYLFITMAGCWAGCILDSRKETLGKRSAADRLTAPIILTISLAIFVCNLTFLYMRLTTLNVVCTTVLLVAAWYVVRRDGVYTELWRKWLAVGALLLLMGLASEAFEGGIKKDPVTFSYLFTTAGLSVMLLIAFSVVCDYYQCHKSTSFLTLSGRNPMAAYVAVDLLIYPLLTIAGLTQYLGIFSRSITGGVMQGVILTSLAVLVTVVCTRLKWVWRT